MNEKSPALYPFIRNNIKAVPLAKTN